MNGNPAGQWIGQSAGEPAGKIVIDLDEVNDGWQGSAYLFPDQSDLPSSFVAISLLRDQPWDGLDVQTAHFNPSSGEILAPIRVREMHPTSLFPARAKIRIQVTTSNELRASWISDINTHGSGDLTRAAPGHKSRVRATPNVSTWEGFKSELLKHKFRSHLYRGQEEPWPLQTSFHRSNRKDLSRYLREDVPELRRALAGKTRHHFDISIPEQFGAFMGLIQHHGYPTPLLDWSYSPFVAAWFAFSARQKSGNTSGSIRIFCVDTSVFRRFHQFSTMTFAPPHFSILETLTIDNPRAEPQQGILTLTNLNDIESHLISLEKQNSCSLITAFDIQASEATKAMNELALMGITRSTLFPGFDSICADIKERAFSDTGI